ncbi:thiol-disulfide oxidoreductase DCC family protein [Photobacterium sp. R1]
MEVKDMKRIRVFYDGSCPSCVRDRAWYESWLSRHPELVEWYDITGRDEALKALGISPEKALRELHVQDQQGIVHRELDAYMLLLNQVWWLRPVAFLMGLPGIRHLLSVIYRRMVDQRLAREGRG